MDKSTSYFGFVRKVVRNFMSRFAKRQRDKQSLENRGYLSYFEWFFLLVFFLTIATLTIISYQSGKSAQKTLENYSKTR